MNFLLGILDEATAIAEEAEAQSRGQKGASRFGKEVKGKGGGIPTRGVDLRNKDWNTVKAGLLSVFGPSGDGDPGMVRMAKA